MLRLIYKEDDVTMEWKEYKFCFDSYNEPLFIGDFIAPSRKDNPDNLPSGYLSEVIQNTKTFEVLITLVDENGNIIADNLNPYKYSTPKRNDIVQNEKYPFFLRVYNSSGQPIGMYYLTENTSLDCWISPNAAYAYLYSNHLGNRHTKTQLEVYGSEFLMTIINTSKMHIVHHEDGNYDTMYGDEPFPIQQAYEPSKTFDNTEDFINYLRVIIAYIKEANLSRIDLDKTMNKSPELDDINNNIVSDLMKK